MKKLEKPFPLEEELSRKMGEIASPTAERREEVPMSSKPGQRRCRGSAFTSGYSFSFGRIKFRTTAISVAMTTGDLPKIMVKLSGN